MSGLQTTRLYADALSRLERYSHTLHRIAFTAMLNDRFDTERRQRFGDLAWRELLMFHSILPGGIVARLPPDCFGIAP